MNRRSGTHTRVGRVRPVRPERSTECLSGSRYALFLASWVRPERPRKGFRSSRIFSSLNGLRDSSFALGPQRGEPEDRIERDSEHLRVTSFSRTTPRTVTGRVDGVVLKKTCPVKFGGFWDASFLKNQPLHGRDPDRPDADDPDDHHRKRPHRDSGDLRGRPLK